jgi:hypothetical protein
MRARNWFMFGAWQVAGALVGLAAHHVDTVSWVLSGLMLLPGTLLSLYVFRQGGTGNNWDKWTVFVVAASLNTLLFATIEGIRRKKEKLSIPKAEDRELQT